MSDKKTARFRTVFYYDHEGFFRKATNPCPYVLFAKFKGLFEQSKLFDIKLLLDFNHADSEEEPSNTTKCHN